MSGELAIPEINVSLWENYDKGSIHTETLCTLLAYTRGAQGILP